jgi:tetraacyldisaccharide 4'-kinase
MPAMAPPSSANPPPTLPPLVLASRSPRRAGLLREAGFDFITLDPPFNDPADPSGQAATLDADAADQARALAQAKAHSLLRDGGLWRRLPAGSVRGTALILAADTIVVDGAGRRLGQPTDRDEAAAMLDRLIDAEHVVVTGVCLLEAAPAGVVRQASWSDTTRVRIGPVDQSTLAAYLDSGDWRGKAGAYNLGELQDRWPFEIVAGEPTTVVGLPMDRLRQALATWGQDEARSQPRGRQQGIIAVMNGQARGLRADLTRAALTCLVPGYAAAVGLRNAAFDMGLRRPHRLPRPTVSIGNITTGGTGKTPMTIELARQLAAAGHHPAVLLRGYRVDGEGHSDEAALLAQALDGMVVVADADRRAGADEALRRAAAMGRAVSVFLLDDGFQHRQVARDLDLVLLDATRPLGFGRLLPRGLLREPADNLRRAAAVIVTRADQVAAEQLTKIDSLVQQITGLRPMAHVAHVWDGLVDDAGQVHPVEALRDRTVVGLCGIANPDAFEAMLRQAGAHVLAMRTFGDHHRYTPADVRAVGELVQRSGAEMVVMTEKDHVKWRQIAVTGGEGSGVDPAAVRRPHLAIRWLHGREALGTLMDQRLGRPRSPDA